MSNEKPPESSVYILGSILGVAGGTIAGIVGIRLAGLISEKVNFEELPLVFTAMGIGYTTGSCIGTTIVAQNKTKVFITNFAAAAIPIGLLCSFDKPLAYKVAGVYGLLVVPIFSAINAYHIDKHEYKKREHISQSTHLSIYTVLMEDLTESMIQRKFVYDRHNYSALGQKINVYKIPLITVSW